MFSWVFLLVFFCCGVIVGGIFFGRVSTPPQPKKVVMEHSDKIADRLRHLADSIDRGLFIGANEKRERFLMAEAIAHDLLYCAKSLVMQNQRSRWLDAYWEEK